MDFHVAGTLELFKDHVVHAAAGVDQGCGDDGERSAFFHVSGRGKKSARALQGVGVNTAGKHFARGRSDGVIGAGQTRDGIEQDDHVALVFHEALGFFQDHFRDLDVSLRRLVEGGADDFALHGALHVRDFFRALVNQQHDERDFRVVAGDGVGERLQHHGFAGARRRDDQSALALADRAEQVEHSARQVFTRRLHFQAALGIERREVVKENFVARDFRIFKVDRFDLDQREIALAVLWRANLSGNGIACSQIELANLRRRYVNIVRAGVQIVVLRSAQEAEAIGQAFEDAFREDQAILLRLGAKDLKDQLLLAHAAGAWDGQVLGDLGQIGDVFFF